MGKDFSRRFCPIAIDHWKPGTIINLGTCGGFCGTQIQKGDIILATETRVYDIYEQMGDPQEAIRYYSCPLDLSWIKKPYPIPVKPSLLISADHDIIPSEIPLLKETYQAVVADWESGAIAWVAARNHIRCLILRGVSDLVDENRGEAYGQFDVFIKGVRQIMPVIINSLPKWID